MPGFQPIGDRARWRVIYDLLRRRSVDDILTYDEMGEALNLDPVDARPALQSAMGRAGREYEETDDRAIEAVANVGYRIVQPDEHLRLARSHQRRSHRALAAGHSKVVHVDMAELSPEARKAFEVVARAFSMQMEFNQRMDIRHKRLREAVDGVVQRAERSEAEIAALKSRLARLEGNGDTESATG